MKKHYLFFTLLLVTSISFGQLPTSGSLKKTQVSNVNMSTSLNEINGFKVYPNPVTNGFFRILTISGNSNEVQIYDMLGKRVLKKQVRQNEIIHVDNLDPGIYILKVEEEGKTVSRKLVIE